MTHTARLLLALFVVSFGAAACGSTPCEDFCDQFLACSQDAGVNADISDDDVDACVTSCDTAGPTDTEIECYVDAVDKGTCTDGLDCLDTPQ